MVKAITFCYLDKNGFLLEGNGIICLDVCSICRCVTYNKVLLKKCCRIMFLVLFEMRLHRLGIQNDKSVLEFGHGDPPRV